MQSNDRYTLDVLLREFIELNSLRDCIVTLWEREALANESLAKYLGRIGVIDSEAWRTLVQMEKGYIQCDPKSLISTDAIHVIRQKLSIIDTPCPRTQAEVLTEHIYELNQKISTDTLPNSAPTIRKPGERIGRCLLTRRLGSGSGGTVYEALHKGLGITVAVKLLPEGNINPSIIDGLQAEAQSLALLNHPNVVRVYDFDGEQQTPYLIMELVVGASLAELIIQSGCLRPEYAAGLIAQAALGLDAASQVGIVHCDVKPGNLLVAKNGQLKLVDFGLCNYVSSSIGQRANGGTVPYMAPERFAGQPSDIYSDMYSLGVTLYQSVTGVLPYVGANSFELMVQHASSPIPDPRVLNSNVPDIIVSVINKCMAKDPADRYRSYADIIGDLSLILHDSHPEVDIPTWHPLRANSSGTIPKSSTFRTVES